MGSGPSADVLAPTCSRANVTRTTRIPPRRQNTAIWRNKGTTGTVGSGTMTYHGIPANTTVNSPSTKASEPIFRSVFMAPPWDQWNAKWLIRLLRCVARTLQTTRLAALFGAPPGSRAPEAKGPWENRSPGRPGREKLNWPWGRPTAAMRPEPKMVCSRGLRRGKRGPQRQNRAVQASTWAADHPIPLTISTFPRHREVR